MSVELLNRLAGREGKDAYKTVGKCPLMTAGELTLVAPLVEGGLITIDESSFPILSNMTMGRAWAVFTEAGREALTAL